MSRVWLLVGLFLVPIGLAALDRLRDPERIGVLVATSTASGEWVGAVQQAMPRLVQGTHFQDRWTLSGQHKPGWLRLVLFDSRQLHANQAAGPYAENCTFVGGRDLVVCDVAMFDKFLHERALDVMPEPYEGDRAVGTPSRLIPLLPDDLAKTRYDLASWILGHEIGHLLNGDAGGNFEGRLEDSTDPDTAQQARELAADASLADRLDDPSGRDIGFYLFLVGVLQVEINRKACPDVAAGQPCEHLQVGAGIIEPDRKLGFGSEGSHPEYLVRLLRLIKIADEKHDLGIIGYVDRQMIDDFLIKAAPPCQRSNAWLPGFLGGGRATCPRVPTEAGLPVPSR